jgi:hypothetical protein
MPPKTRSSTSKALPPSDVASTPTDDRLDDVSPSVSNPFDDHNVLAKVLDSIKATNDSVKANQAAIDAINLKLASHSASIDSTTMALVTLDDTVTALNHTIAALPNGLDTQLSTAKQVLRSKFLTKLGSLSNQLYQDLSSHCDDTNTYFKNHVTTFASLRDNLLTVTKDLTVLQDTTLSTLDIECIVVQKWEDELDPHIQSHYDFKRDASAHLDSLDQNLQDTTNTLMNHPFLTNTTMV